MIRFVQEGNSFDFKNDSAADISAGMPIIRGKLHGISKRTVKVGEVGAAHKDKEAIFEIQVPVNDDGVNQTIFAPGEEVYLDANNSGVAHKGPVDTDNGIYYLGVAVPAIGISRDEAGGIAANDGAANASAAFVRFVVRQSNNDQGTPPWLES